MEKRSIKLFKGGLDIMLTSQTETESAFSLHHNTFFFFLTGKT